MIEVYCLRCHRLMVGWPLHRADICAPKDWAHCLRWPVRALMIALTASLLLCAPAGAEQWRIEGPRDSLRMRPLTNSDPARTYRGEIERDGTMRLHNWRGDTLRGQIHPDGTGTLRGLDGTTYRVRP
jgi:hypothetical protein